MKGPAYRSQMPAGPAPGATGGCAQWVVFALDAGRYALPLSSVERIVRAAEVTAIPLAPEVVLGAIDIEGRILPVFSLRRRFGLKERALEPSDQFLIARTRRRTVALVIDTAQGLIGHPPADIVEAKHIEASLEQIQGVIPLEGGMLLIQDLEKLLSADEERALDEALKEKPGGR